MNGVSDCCLFADIAEFTWRQRIYSHKNIFANLITEFKLHYSLNSNSYQNFENYLSSFVVIGLSLKVMQLYIGH